MPDPTESRPGTPGRLGTQRADHGRPGETGSSAAEALSAQESGASGGPVPTADELSGRPRSRADVDTDVESGQPLRPGEHGDTATTRDNASQHQVQGTADNDSDHEHGDQSQGAPKRMD